MIVYYFFQSEDQISIHILLLASLSLKLESMNLHSNSNLCALVVNRWPNCNCKMISLIAPALDAGRATYLARWRVPFMHYESHQRRERHLFMNAALATECILLRPQYACVC